MFNNVQQFVFVPIQNSFGVLRRNRKVIDIFDERGDAVANYIHPENEHRILSFALSFDMKIMKILLYLSNKQVVLVKRWLRQEGEKEKIPNSIFVTDLYLEEEKYRISHEDEPEVSFIDDGMFALQFKNGVYLLKLAEITNGSLKYPYESLIDIVHFQHCIFRIYKNSVTIQSLANLNAPSEERDVLPETPERKMPILHCIVTQEEKPQQQGEGETVKETFNLHLMTIDRVPYTFTVDLELK